METPAVSDFMGSTSSGSEDPVKSTSEEILSLLRVMLAEALNQHDRNLAAQLYETIRSISNLDEVKKLFLVTLECKLNWSQNLTMLFYSVVQNYLCY